MNNLSGRFLMVAALLASLTSAVEAGTLTLDGTWQSLAGLGATAGQCATLTTDDGSGQVVVASGNSAPAAGTVGRQVSTFAPFSASLSAPLYVRGPSQAHVSVDTGLCAGNGKGGGSTGTDYSANAPTIPLVGANFAASGPFANYQLIRTIPASASRNAVEIVNMSGARIAIVRDDGTAASGTAPVAATVIPIEGGSAAGAQGGGYASTTFKGRLQIYAPSASALVAADID